MSLLYRVHPINAVYLDNLDGNFTDPTMWTVDNSSGLTFTASEMLLSPITSYDFPYVRSSTPIISSTDKSVEIKFKYSSVGGFGTGFAITDINPPYGTVMTYPSKFNQYSIFYVWQNNSQPYLHVATSLCPSNNSGCNLSSIRTIYQTVTTDLNTHVIKFEWDNAGIYSVFLDGIIYFLLALVLEYLPIFGSGTLSIQLRLIPGVNKP